MSQGPEINTAFYLAAGFGTRMGNLTSGTPKPLLEISGIPMMIFGFYMLERLGVRKVIVNTHYLSGQMESFLNKIRRKISFEIVISHEPEILGTAGGIKKALLEQNLPKDNYFYLLNSDILPEPVPGDFFKKLDFQNTKPLSFLFMKEKDPQSRETGWDISDNNIVFFNNSGKFYYTGFSIVHPDLLKKVEEGKFAELGGLWIEAASEKRLQGMNYPGRIVSCGMSQEYEGIKNNMPDFFKEDPAFIKFALPLRS